MSDAALASPMALYAELQTLGWERVRVRRVAPDWLELEATLDTQLIGYLVVVWPACWRDATALAPHVRRARSGNYALVLIGEPDVAVATQLRDVDLGWLRATAPAAMLTLELGHRLAALEARLTQATLELEVERARYENDMLLSLGRALSRERDPLALMNQILQRACELANADAGSIFSVEAGTGDEAVLRFVAARNDSRVLAPVGRTLAVSRESIVGACALSAEMVQVDDLYQLDAPGTGNNPWGLVHDRSFDVQHGYQTRSVLAVPMISARDEVVGVIQLINRRGKGWLRLEAAEDFDRGVIAFDAISAGYVNALASQAGIALENVRLYDEVKGLFDGFVKASVTAIEARDPSTSGHSERVAKLTTAMARAMNHHAHSAGQVQVFDADALTQIEYAALLHDFGKVGVREHVLTKAKKLYEHERALIMERMRYVARGHRLVGAQRMLAAPRAAWPEIEGATAEALVRLDEIIAFVLASNEPSVLPEGSFDRIAELAAERYHDDTGQLLPLLLPHEAAALQIRKGSLTEPERDEINQHVTHTYNYLCRIPWGASLQGVPAIAGAHHEKLDGSGYPWRRQGAHIPVAARMMTIADIYDALTAADRPYKRAVPHPKALDILFDEAKQGKLDADLLKVFVDATVWNVLSEGGV